MTERKLRRPVEELRAELLADPRTQRMAQTLGLSTEAYVEKVLDYAQHPEKQPQFNVLPEGEVKAQGGATVAEVQGWLQDLASGKTQLGPKQYTDGFEDAPRGNDKPLPKKG